MTAKVWFITGTSKGFGRIWAQAALARGDRVAATARNVATLQPLLDQYGDQVLAIALDVDHKAAVDAAVAETIANNVRSKIIKEKINDPAFYDSMAALLNDVLADLRANRITYEEFLQKIGDLATQVQSGKAESTPVALDTPGKRALFNNLGKDEALALKIDAEVKRVRPDGFRGSQAKENIIKRALLTLLGNDVAEVERIFAIIKAQSEY